MQLCGQAKQDINLTCGDEYIFLCGEDTTRDPPLDHAAASVSSHAAFAGDAEEVKDAGELKEEEDQREGQGEVEEEEVRRK